MTHEWKFWKFSDIRILFNIFFPLCVSLKITGDTKTLKNKGLYTELGYQPFIFVYIPFNAFLTLFQLLRLGHYFLSQLQPSNTLS